MYYAVGLCFLSSRKRILYMIRINAATINPSTTGRKKAKNVNIKQPINKNAKAIQTKNDLTILKICRKSNAMCFMMQELNFAISLF